MLLLISEFFILFDFFVTVNTATVDVIPDFPGFVLLMIFFIRQKKKKYTGPIPALLCIPGIIFSALSHAPIRAEWFVFLRYFVPISLIIPLMLRAYDCICRDSMNYRYGPDSESLSRYRSVILWALVLIVICMAGTFITQLFPTLYIILYVIRLIAAAYILFRERTVIFYSLP